MADPQPITYQPQFQPPVWKDNVDPILAEGPTGFNIQFKNLRAEFDKLSFIIKQLSDTIISVNQTLSTQITSLSQIVNTANTAANTAQLATHLATWTLTKPPSAAYSEHTATLLSNGKVLVAGGFNSGTLAGLYDPSSDTWSTTGSLNVAHNEHTATLLPNGKVLVAGGRTTTAPTASITYTASAELYDPSSGTWSTTGSMSVDRSRHTATILPNGKVLVAGGEGGTSINPIPTASIVSAELYDPSSGTWSTTGSMSVSRSQHTATLLPNGKILVAGGISTSDFTASAELYDPSSGTWSTTGSMSVVRYQHTATRLPNGKVLVAGGGGGTTPYTTTSAELYDPSSGTWSTTGSMSTARYIHTATLDSNGQVVVAGGMNDTGGSIISAEIYDPSGNTWSSFGSLNVARYSHTATLLTPANRILIVGGYDVSGSSKLLPAEKR